MPVSGSFLHDSGSMSQQPSDSAVSGWGSTLVSSTFGDSFVPPLPDQLFITETSDPFVTETSDPFVTE